MLSSAIFGSVTATRQDSLVAGLLTLERLESYLSATGGDLSAALRLYEWNSAATGSLLSTTGLVEVIVRNALDTQLLSWALRRGELDWFDIVPLDGKGRRDIAMARTRAKGNGVGQERHGKVIAELSFGFWRYLVAQRYLTTLWIPALAAAFPYGAPDRTMRRQDVENKMVGLHIIRNRAAHNEPIHRRDLCNDWLSAIELVGWVHPDGAAWVASNSTLGLIAKNRPVTQ